MSQLSRIEILLKESMEDLPILVQNAKTHDARGVATASLIGTHRFIGVAEYLVNGDVSAFRRELSVSAQCQLDLLDRFESGGDISPSYAGMTGGYKALLDALAAGNNELSKDLASKIGGREMIEKENDHSFDLSFGYALKAAVLQSGDLDQRLSTFSDQLSKPGNRDFQGYADAFMAMRLNDSEKLAVALSGILAGHKRQAKGNGVFKGTEDEALCVWGVAIVNLSISQGLAVDIDDPLIPRALLTLR